jgi:Flp pilus assembly protein TadD
MRKTIAISVLVVGVLLGGCATTGNQDAHVLSGEASVERIVGRADQAVAEGDDFAATILYRQALSQEPSADLWYRLGMAQMRQEGAGQAMWAFRNALQLDPDHARSLERIGFFLTAKDRAADARPYLDRLLGLEPDNWRAHNALGVLADLEGRHVEAAGHFAAAIERNPESPMLWNNLGYSYYLAGDDAAAHRAIASALQMQPNHTAARHNLALLLARQRRYDEALAMMKPSRGESQAYADVGYLAYKLGDYRKAEELLGEAIRSSSTYNRQAHQSLAAVREARAAQSRGG